MLAWTTYLMKLDAYAPWAPWMTGAAHRVGRDRESLPDAARSNGRQTHAERPFPSREGALGAWTAPAAVSSPRGGG